MDCKAIANAISCLRYVTYEEFGLILVFSSLAIGVVISGFSFLIEVFFKR